MNTDVTQSKGTGYTSGGCDKVVSFAGYVARHGRKAPRYTGEETNLVRLAGCDVVDLAERRN